LGTVLHSGVPIITMGSRRRGIFPIALNFAIVPAFVQKFYG